MIVNKAKLNNFKNINKWRKPPRIARFNKFTL